MNFNITFSKKALGQFNSLDKSIKLRIKNAIYSKLIINPDANLKPLLGKILGYYKFRVGDYRLICLKEDNQIIVAGIGHRKEVYKTK